MNNQNILKIGAGIFAIIVIIVVILMVIKKDNFQYPSGQLYAPSGKAEWIRQPGNGGQSITQTSVSALVTDQSGNINVTAPIPIGGIIMWAGSINSIPNGWGLCNGTTYSSIQSPDLTSRFVVGAGQSANPSDYVTQYDVGDMGGEEFHQLEISELPSHGHQLGLLYNNYSAGSYGDGVGSVTRGSQSALTQLEGGDPNNKNQTLPHNNMPPYYALAYIIKYE